MKFDKVKALKELIYHIILITFSFIVLIPVIYVLTSGFRTNQVMYGSVIDYNSWIDTRIADSKESKISKKNLYNKIIVVLSDISSEDQKYPAIDVKALEKNIPFYKIIKRFINLNGNEKYFEEFLVAYEEWLKDKSATYVQKVNSELFSPDNANFNYKYQVRVSTDNYRAFFSGKVSDVEGVNYPIFKWFLNSMFISGMVTIIQLFVIAMAAYSLSRFRFFGKKFTFLYILVLQIFPSSMTMIALYILLQYIGGIFPLFGLDSKLGLILVYLGIGVPLNIWLARGYFDSLPTSIEEAAIIDGATHFQTFTRIIIPLSMPIVVVIAILSFIATYNEFMIALAILSKIDNFNLPIGLSFFVAYNESMFGIFSAASFIGTAPIVIVWLALQKNIISGLTTGAVKM